jgi:hypothetical protein
MLVSEIMSFSKGINCSKVLLPLAFEQSLLFPRLVLNIQDCALFDC